MFVHRSPVIKIQGKELQGVKSLNANLLVFSVVIFLLFIVSNCSTSAQEN